MPKVVGRTPEVGVEDGHISVNGGANILLL